MRTTRFMRSCYEKDGSMLLLNTYTGDLLRISQDKISEVKNVLDNPDAIQNSSIKDYLEEKNFIIKDFVDESAKAELRYLEVAHDANRLLLIILPTEDCNFRCQYCYEEHNVGRMTQKIIDAIKKYVKNNLIKYDMLQVNWFGGEPLEAIDIIEDLSEYFIDICAKQKKPYRASITTNGYLLTADLFNKLYALHIVDFQITLDGIEKTHNMSRPHKDGHNSYRNIVRNLFDIRDNVKTKNVNIIIRTNITKSVMDIIDEHIELLDKELFVIPFIISQ